MIVYLLCFDDDCMDIFRILIHAICDLDNVFLWVKISWQACHRGARKVQLARGKGEELETNFQWGSIHPSIHPSVCSVWLQEQK